MVHGQEEAWQERQRHQGDEDEVNHINCLAALSLVNKELHGMACRHIFEVVRASRSQDPMFANAILLRRRNHISHVNFDYVSVVDNSDISLPPSCCLPFRLSHPSTPSPSIIARPFNYSDSGLLPGKREPKP